ncbi:MULTISPECIES: hypothetical protein [Clostridium]|nr:MULTISPECIES: hypothetical protein [Clostridium]MBS4958169.1 hypothetical protein [Clostridium sp.]
MIWIIYRKRNKLEAPRAIPFDDNSPELAQEWINEKENEYEILDVAES